MFPLQLVAFPGERLNLHIFEPRYRELIHECHENGSTFGIPPYLKNKLMDFGTEMKLLEISKTYDDGKMDIKTQGIGIFRIEDFDAKAHGKLYAGAHIERMEIEYDGEFTNVNKLLDLMEQLFKLLKINKDIPENTPQFTAYDIAHHVGLSIEKEYEFLRIPNELSRQEYLIDHITQLIPIVQNMEALRKRVQMNGHFKNFNPLDFK